MTVNAFLRIVLICCCLCSLCPVFAESRPQSVKVVMDDNYPPFSFKDSTGKQQGILIDQWRLWEQKSGIKAEIHAMDWGKALRGMKAGEFDVIDTIFKTAERSDWLDFTKPYAKLEVPIFFDKEISGITNADSLKGFVVAAKSGDAAVDILKRSGIDNIAFFDSYEAIILAAREHKITVFVVDKPPALYYLHKFGINQNYKQSAPLNVGEFHRAVKKGNSELLRAVEDGFAQLSPDELKKIESTWYGTTLLDRSAVRYSFSAAAILAILVLTLYIRNLLLRKAVHKRTTELKSSEELLDDIIEQSPISMAIVSLDGTIERINRRAIETFGYLPEDIPDMDHWWVLAYPDETYRAEVFEQWMGLVGKALAEKHDIEPREYRVTCKDGTVKTVLIFGKPVSNKVFVIFDDITERKKAEEERLTLERQLLHTQKLESLGVLSGGIAHDFNNLLQAILGNLDLARMKLPSDAAPRMNIDQAVNACKHAAKLTNMMLAYSGKGLFAIKRLHLTELVEENATMLEAAIPKSIELALHLDYDLPDIKADAGQLQQVIMNLITNAAEAIGNAGGTINLSTGVAEFDQSTLNQSRLDEKTAQGRYVWLKVQDNGCGMSKDILNKLFDPFFTTKFTGRGLGMSAVQGIIRAHKGAFLAESTPGSGTTITVLFPLADDLLPGFEQAGETPALQENPGVRALSILIVDDEEMVRSVANAMLEELGYMTITAAGGQEALAIFRAEGDSIAAVLLDQAMPGMDGATVIKELRRIRPDVKVLLSSGFSEQEIAARFDGLKLDGFVPKPYNLQKLNDRLRLLLKEV